jgi:L-amino acid N-acyltransferase
MWKMRPAVEADVPQINGMVNYFIRETTVNWSWEERSMEEALAWFRDHKPPFHPIYVIEEDDIIVAYGSLSHFRPKAGYWPVAENSVYVRPEYKGRGMGKALMKQLIEDAKTSGLWAITAWISSENADSILFHEKLGFYYNGEMRNIGDKFGRKLSVTIMQLDLNAEEKKG